MVTYIRSDLDFILQQILIAEADAAGADLSTLLPNSFVPFGLRTVDGSFNNVVPGQSEFGASDNLFPRLTDPVFQDAQTVTVDLDGPGGQAVGDATSYDQTTGFVFDSQPRTISNLIVDQTITNPAAVQAFVDAGFGILVGPPGSQVLHYLEDDGITPGAIVPAGVTLSLPNTTPDEGLSAGFNLWFTFFGQFFDHGLDLLQKGGNGTVFIPLQPDDPLITHGPDGIAGTGDEVTNPALQFMVLTRATQVNGPGADGILGDDPTTVGVDESLDDTTHESINTTSPFVDQNQTYTSNPSHQVFLREYQFNAAGDPVATGKLITNRNLVDGVFGNGNDVDLRGMSTWAVVKAQARDLLGIQLSDYDAVNVPMIRVDPYGNFVPGANGFAQLVVGLGADGIAQTDDDVLMEGDPLAPISPLAVGALRTGQMFLADIAHSANPFSSQTGLALAPDAGDTIGDDFNPNTYDDELLAEHFMAGDGRVNENIGLTAVHHVFHAEHNRLVEHTKDVALADAQQLLAGGATQAEAVAFLNNWLAIPITDLTGVTKDDLTWNGERLFQAAKFGTEMQYQHLVFEEFARKVQPMVDVFLAPEGFDTTINPAIFAEFAHTVYRFGHSMLLESIDRLDPDFVSSELGLIQAFLNPLAFDANDTLTPEEAAGAIVRGTTRQLASEIDEFKVEALRNNLLGLPLDLAAINIARGRDTGIPSFNHAREQFYAMTSDSQLKPYTSWADFLQNLKHAESLINFIAAYGTHTSITTETTLAGKRDAATLIVLGGAGAPADRLDFLHATGDYTGGSLGGLNNVDFWIGGLAEKQMPFGGLLGSTFNFVFETQMENLQNGDRFYYLARLAGLNFLTEMENNSFAKLVMLNTDATHLPAEVFTTPAFILEVDRSKQHTGLDDPINDTDAIVGNSDPTGGTFINGVEITPLVIRDNPATDNPLTPFDEGTANYLQYTGVDHVVLGGTEGDDIIISSIGDDTLWGDGGNDRLEGGDGVDNVEGGAGDDIITDLGGDDILKGNDGNDVISAGNGFNLILGGAGSDFIITGEDVSETFGGTGNDFILGAQMNLPTFGNEGDDWIEIGTSDGAGGDNFDPQEAGTVIGHDVFITGGGFDEADGEGGDDILVGSDGEDHFGGGGGFDWASYKNDPFGVSVDLTVNDLIEPPVAPSNQGILDRFVQVEGLAGSAFSDVLRGDDADAAEINTADAQNSALNQAGIDRIAGLQGLLGAGVTSFFSGNIILGGAGSDIIEGRGGDDLIDGDRTLNVRISVRAGFGPTGPTGPETEIATFDSMSDPLLLQNMLNGVWNPGQLQIVREILPGAPGFDTAVFSGNRADYSIAVNGTVTNGPFTVGADDIVTVTDNSARPIDGADRLTHIERLQFADQAIVLTPGLNAEPSGLLTLDDTTPEINQILTVSAADIVDADNLGLGGTITDRPISFVWQAERVPGSGVFTDIVALGGGNPATALGNTFRVTPDLAGLALRARAVYQDDNGVLENVFSAPTSAVTGVASIPLPTVLPAESATTSPGGGLHLIRADLQFILDQIKFAEGSPDGNVLGSIANSRLPFGLRTVDGTFNNLVQGQTNFGASDQNFPLLLDQKFRNEGDDTFDPDGVGPAPLLTNNNYAALNALGAGRSVIDADPRIISNLISDQTITNPVAVQAFVDAGFGILVGDVLHYLNDDGTPGDVVPPSTTLTLPNRTPDEGLSAGFNSWFTFFGQFFDHGLDLVDKGGNGTVFMPLNTDDPLYDFGANGVANDGLGTNLIDGDEVGDLLDDDGAGADGLFGTIDDSPNFMALTRATNTSVSPGADGMLGTSDDVHTHNNETTPFVDQNQTYTSHASHQVFLREYALDGAGNPVNTGRLIDGANGGIGNWAEVKAQAQDMLGLILSDFDVHNVPLVEADAYGRFIPGPNGFAQVWVTFQEFMPGATPTSPPIPVGAPILRLIEGTEAGLNLANVPVPGDIVPALGNFILPAVNHTGHAFLNDIAHHASPGIFDTDGNPGTPGIPQVADTDAGPEGLFGDDHNPATYDNELLDKHLITGDGRGNENIGLTSVHFIFHAEHNRMVEHIKDVAIASNDVTFLNQWLTTPVGTLPTTPAEIADLDWNGERVFQAARFSTEMQYQHLVFEEFARKVQPQVDVFLMEGQGYDSTINPAIVAEFAHVVYRFGHSLLPDTIDRLDANFNSSEIGLIEAFLNPLQFTASGATDAEAAGAIIRGVTRQLGNEIDELVTEAVRNNLLGLPLDLPAINLARGRDTGVPSLNEARAEFYSWTGDSQLKPYASWAEFVQHLKHPGSLINFIAAYGTHAAITGETTLEGKRAAATLLVLGDGDDSDGVTIGANTYMDRLDFLNATGAYAPDGLGPNDDSRGGLNNVDLWIGGLAEKQMPFGGLLGSTFNYVFENQMEKLQNGDRFYYLERTAGLNFLTELENNSFAKLIMANTDTTHLPGDVFSTPAFTLEVDQSKQFTGIENLQQAIGQSGTITVNQPTGDTWHTVTFDGPISDAVVVMMVNTNNELQPAPVRVRNVTLSGFEFQIDEWEENNDVHLSETLSWLAMSAGEHELPDGTRIHAGYRSADNNFAHVDFDTDFTGTPVVLAQVSSTVDTSTVTTRLTNVTTGGFDVRVQEQQGNLPAHGIEQVGWIAIAQGVTTTLAADAGNLVGNNPETILYGSTFSISPVFLAQMQTQLDADPAAVRGFTFDEDSASVFVQEEASVDPDLTHSLEDVGFVALNAGVILPGIPIFNADPTEGGTALTPLVIRNNPATPGPDTNYLQYTGEDHVVLGGTDFNDIIISSIGDDTLYGDAGNDRLEGGDGVDIIFGGTGDDIITDKGGDDNLQGQDGNDAIHGGNGVNLILGGFGNDFIVTGEDESEAFGGPGNDFIFGVKPVEMLFGNEGDDWIEHGMADGSAGENFDTRGLDSIIGNDVFMGDTVADRMLGEGGDDIMVGNGGQVDRYIGSSGFDWAVFKHDTLAANADLNLRAFDETPVPQSVASTLARFESVEGLSGSQFSDILRGDDADAAAIAASGFTGSVLTNFGLIAGLQDFVGDGVTSFSSGNIILGGDGSDLIEGRGGDDLIDGDLAMNVRISWRTDVNDPDSEIESADSMTAFTERVFSGEINPGQLVIVREILPGIVGAFNFDTAVYSGNLADYTIEIGDSNTPLDFTDDVITVTHNDATAPNGIGIDGVDTLTHIERLQFNDQSFTPPLVAAALHNSDPVGLLTILDAATDTPDNTPVPGQLLRVSIADVTDANNVATLGAITGPVTYVWQFEPRPGTGLFEDIILATGLGDVRATGETFTVTEDLGNLALRVRALYQDANGVLETVFSAPTAPVEIPDPPVITSDGGEDTAIVEVVENTVLATTVTADDPDPGAIITFSIDGGADASAFDIDPVTGALTFLTAPDFEVPTDIGANNVFDVIVKASDGILFDTQAIAVTVLDVNDTPTIAGTIGTPGDDVLVGTSGDDLFFGDGGNDLLFGLGGEDTAQFFGTSANFIFSLTPEGVLEVNDTIAGTVTTVFSIENFLFVNGLDSEVLTLAQALATIPAPPSNGDDLIIGTAADDDITGLGGNDTIFGFAGADVIHWNAGDGHDVVNAGADGLPADGVGDDRFRIRGNGESETFNVYAPGSVPALAGLLGVPSNPNNLALRTTAEIVITRTVGATTEIVAELSGVDDIRFNGGGGADVFNLVGDFTGTDLNPNTIEIIGTGDDETVNLLGGFSGTRVVFHGGGGNDTMNGQRSNDVFDSAGMPGSFILTQSDLDGLLNLINGGPVDDEGESEFEGPVGVRVLSGIGQGVPDDHFIRLTDAHFGANGAINPLFADVDPRNISNILGAQETNLAKNAAGANIFFMAFGQYFDHGLDFLLKGGNGKIIIDGVDIGHGQLGTPNFADLTRASVTGFDGETPLHTNKTSPFVDQNQAYGSHELVGQFLRAGDGNGGYGSHLFQGAEDPNAPGFFLLPTLRELILHHVAEGTVFGNGQTLEEYYPGLVVGGVVAASVAANLAKDFMGSGQNLLIDANPGVSVLDHFIAGDGRTNENIALTSMHTIWARNHNFHVENLLEAGFDGTTEELFQAAKMLNEAEYQSVVFNEFADGLLGGMRGSGHHGFDEHNPNADPRISHEFAAAAYRFGHSLIADTLKIMDADGNMVDVPLTQAFLNPARYANFGAGNILGGIATQQAEEVDFNLVNAVRNDLVNIRADLFSFNVARSWDVGLGTLNQVRAGLAASDDPYVTEAVGFAGDLSPYDSWEDFRNRNGLSTAVMSQFMAAYPDLVLDPTEIADFVAANPDITLVGGNTVKGIDRVDLWVGGLAEKHVLGGQVGQTFWVVLHEQLDRLQEADRFYYIDRFDDFDLYADEFENQSFADIVERNTGLTGLPEEIFLAASADEDEDDDTDNDSDNDDDDDNDDDSDNDDTDDNDDDGEGQGTGGTGNSALPFVVYIGTGADDTSIGGAGHDTLAGEGGEDTLFGLDGNDNLAGGAGADQLIGGAGNDILIGNGGNDTILAGAGNDTVLAGSGDDTVFGDEGDDLIFSNEGRDVINGGAGNDTIFASIGDGADVFNGGEGSDTLDLEAITASLVVDLGSSGIGSSASAQSDIDTLSGIENVKGGSGNDTIIASNSVNLLAGGAGSDTFVFKTAAAANGDTIDGFEPGDMIDLRPLYASLNLGNTDGFDIVANFNAAGQLKLHVVGEDTIIEGNTDNDNSDADFGIKIAGRTNLTSSDFA